MASEITASDSLFVVGEKPWHGLGTILDNPPSCEDAIKIAGIDWTVEQVPIYAGTKQVEGYLANIRSDNKDVLGIITKKYKVVQNIEAFDFVNDIMNNNDVQCQYESAGSLSGGKRVWLLAKIPDRKVLDLDVSSYLFFTNSHDGKSSLKCGLTDIQIVCNNTLQLAIKNAPRMWSLRHMSSIEGKKKEAMETLGFAKNYIEEFNKKAEILYNKKYNIDKFLDILLPIKDVSERIKRNVEKSRDYIKNIHNNAEYMQNFKNTAWGCYQSVTDWYSNSEPLRKTDTFENKRLAEFFDGSTIYETTQQILEA
jgi:phage/plasmid-like protein (TIGR03299 family)